MEVCESGGEQPPLLHWDRKLSELCEPADPETLLSRTVRRGRGWDGMGSVGGSLGSPWAGLSRWHRVALANRCCPPLSPPLPPLRGCSPEGRGVLGRALGSPLHRGGLSSVPSEPGGGSR